LFNLREPEIQALFNTLRMKVRYLLISIVLLYSIGMFAQNPIRINEPAQSFANGLYSVSGDTLVLKYMKLSQDWRTISGSEEFKMTEIINHQGIIAGSITTLKQDMPFYHGVSFDWRNNSYEIGSIYNSGRTDSCTIWIKKQNEPFDSAYFLPLSDSGFAYIDIYKALPLNNHLYAFGTLKQSSNFSQAAIFKIDLSLKTFVIKTFDCFASFRSFQDAFYDPIAQNFIVTSFFQIENPNPPFGAGICKLDTNLNLIMGSNQTLQSNYATHLIASPNPYHYVAGIEPIDRTSFLCVGTGINPLQVPSQTMNPNGNYLDDIIAGQRSNSTLLENSLSYAHGRIDTGESSFVGFMPFKRIDSNMFYVGMTSRFYNPEPEPWDTELALFGLNGQGQKHWEYYQPLNDYCYINDIIPDQNGGLWFVAQCSENLNLSTGTYESFIKVGYVDSVAFWPRIGAVGIAVPQKKQEEIVVYPNPTADLLKIKQYGFLQTLYYKLYDLEGRLVKENRVQSHIHELNLGELKPALYLLRVEDEKGGLVKEEKVVKR